MNATARRGSPLLRLALADGVTLSADNGAVTFGAPWADHRTVPLGSAARSQLEALSAGSVQESAAEEAILRDRGVNALCRFYFDTATLIRRGLVRLVIETDGESPRRIAALDAISPDFHPRTATIAHDTEVRISRFSVIRRDGERLALESPLAHARVRLHSSSAAALVSALAARATAREAAAQADTSEDEAVALLLLLLRAGVASALDPDGMLPEDRDEALRQWEPHDLLFHARSRAGRHSEPIGGRYRFLGQIPPQPAVKTAEWPLAVVLPRPDLDLVAAGDPSLTAAIEGRHSTRLLQGTPPSIAQIGEFLYRVARVRGVRSYGAKGELTSRPYPSGGASYELELYLNVEEGAELPAGLYWYDPILNALRLVRWPNDDTRALMWDAHTATAGLAWPRVLIVIAARFQRVSWKYESMAYATILKNVGVLYSTMYLVATAMGLAACAVGIGNADRFARAAGTAYAVETSVGEFALCGSEREGRPS